MAVNFLKYIQTKINSNINKNQIQSEVPEISEYKQTVHFYK